MERKVRMIHFSMQLAISSYYRLIVWLIVEAWTHLKAVLTRGMQGEPVRSVLPGTKNQNGT